jgi:hypothetical protein
MLKSSRRQARLTNKTRLSVSRGELDGSEVVILEDEYSKGNLNQDGVEKGEDQGTSTQLVRHPLTLADLALGPSLDRPSPRPRDTTMSRAGGGGGARVKNSDPKLPSLSISRPSHASSSSSLNRAQR